MCIDHFNHLTVKAHYIHSESLNPYALIMKLKLKNLVCMSPLGSLTWTVAS